MRTDEPAGALVLAATDPANPFGATLPWPKRENDDSGRRPSRVRGRLRRDARRRAGALRGARRQGPAAAARARRAWLQPALEALAEAVKRGRVPRLGIERFDGEPVVGSPTGELLIELGFRQSPRRLTLSA